MRWSSDLAIAAAPLTAAEAARAVALAKRSLGLLPNTRDVPTPTLNPKPDNTGNGTAKEILEKLREN